MLAKSLIYHAYIFARDFLFAAELLIATGLGKALYAVIICNIWVVKISGREKINEKNRKDSVYCIYYYCLALAIVCTMHVCDGECSIQHILASFVSRLLAAWGSYRRGLHVLKNRGADISSARDARRSYTPLIAFAIARGLL